MTGFEIPELGALVSAIKFLFESIGRQIEIPAEKRRQWFDDHIEPSYKQLTAIHDDYTKQFSRALDLLTKENSLEEVVQFLKAERPNHLLNRQEIREKLLALRDYRQERRRKLGSPRRPVSPAKRIRRRRAPVESRGGVPREIRVSKSLVSSRPHLPRSPLRCRAVAKSCC